MKNQPFFLQCSVYIIHPCLPCCYHFYRMCSPVDNSGTPQGISALEEHIFTIYLPAATYYYTSHNT